MPDTSIYPQEDRCSKLENYAAFGRNWCTTHGELKHPSLAPLKSHDRTLEVPTSHARGSRTTTRGTTGAKTKFKVTSDTPRSKGQRRGSSQYYGVRLRKKIQKYAAELRVSEWKTVNKKVWLGTYNSEKEAALAVDIARVALKCKKKRPFNLPDKKLSRLAPTLQIPPTLVLSDVKNKFMIQEVINYLRFICKKHTSDFETLEPTPCHLSASTAYAHNNTIDVLSHEKVDMHPNSKLSILHTNALCIFPLDLLCKTMSNSSDWGDQGIFSNSEYTVDSGMTQFTSENMLPNSDQPLYDIPSFPLLSISPLDDHGRLQEHQEHTPLGIESNEVIFPAAAMTIQSKKAIQGFEKFQEPDDTCMEFHQHLNPAYFTPQIPDPTFALSPFFRDI